MNDLSISVELLFSFHLKV